MLKNLRKNNNIFKILFVIVLFLVIIILSFNFVNLFLIIDQKEINTSFIASDHAGFDLNPNELTFGMVPVGQGSVRGLFITNDFDKKVKVILKSRGEISDFLIVSENSFYLKPNEEKKIEFSILLPQDLEFKKYKGKIEVIFKRA